jgi:group I intron endonuclease
MQEKLFYIYKITNKINNKIYVGKTNNPVKRFQNHISRSRTLKTNQPIHFAMAKYGKDNFVFEIIETCCDAALLNAREIFWIENLKSNQKIIGYNITNGGEGSFGRMQTETTKNKISKSMKGANNHLYGKHHSELEKQQISLSNEITKLNYSKLSRQDIIDIKNLIIAGKLKGIEIAKLFNTTPAIISKIKHNKIWSRII